MCVRCSIIRKLCTYTVVAWDVYYVCVLSQRSIFTFIVICGKWDGMMIKIKSGFSSYDCYVEWKKLNNNITKSEWKKKMELFCDSEITLPRKFWSGRRTIKRVDREFREGERELGDVTRRTRGLEYTTVQLRCRGWYLSNFKWHRVLALPPWRPLFRVIYIYSPALARARSSRVVAATSRRRRTTICYRSN